MTFRRELNRDHLRALFKIEVNPDQDDQVAPNAVTIAQAAYEAGSGVWGLWDGDRPVGLMAMINLSENPDRETGEDDVAYLWRLMVAGDEQGKGFGKRALAEVAEIAKGWGKARILVTSVEAPTGSIPFYERHGFTRTGRVIHDEVELVIATADLKTATA